jgi:WD40 repeat protein
VWDAINGSYRSTLKDYSGSTGFVTFSPDGQLIASVSGEDVEVWDVATGSSLHTLEGHSNFLSTPVGFSADSQLIASGSYDYTVRLWQVSTGSCLHTLEDHGGLIEAVTFSPDGQLVATVSDKTVRL